MQLLGHGRLRGASGPKGINWKLNWRKSTRQKNCTSNREAVRNGCFKVMLTPASFIFVLMVGKGKLGFVL
jgi:hypothetical protein